MGPVHSKVVKMGEVVKGEVVDGEVIPAKSRTGT